MILSRFFQRRAFTLIELLTVIAIVGVLAAILFPAFGKIRETARATKCSANLRTWFEATGLYVADHKGRLPPTDYKMVTVNGANLAQDAYLYLNRYIVPPENPCYTYGYNQTMLADFTCTTRSEAGNNLVWAAYAFNYAPSALMVSAIPSPSRLIWATEAAGGGGGQRWVTAGMLVPSCANLGATTAKPHNDKNNVLYLDGHVSAQALRDIVKADFTRGTSVYNAADETVRMAN